MAREFSDLSRWQASIRWPRYKDDEVGLKATQDNYVDPTYARRVKAAHQRKIAVHHYDFGTPGSDKDVKAQARFFVETVRPHWHGADFATIDVEQAGFDGHDVEVWQDTVHALAPHWQQEIYGSPYYLQDHGVHPKYGALLWLADYAAKIAFVPHGWKTWDRWQFTNEAHVSAIPGSSDRSRINPAALREKHHPRKPVKFAPLLRRRLRKVIKELDAGRRLSPEAHKLYRELRKAVQG